MDVASTSEVPPPGEEISMYANKEQLAAVVTTLLDKLGALGTPEQIRDYFVQEQITGNPRNGYLCPVHTYLMRELDAVPFHMVSVGTSQVAIGLDPLMVAIVKQPHPVTQLIDLFNNGAYDELLPPV